MLYLGRNDGRIKNQKTIEEYLSKNFEARIVRDMQRYNYTQKRELISSYNNIVMPPGSENINALCFSNSKCNLYQMIPGPISKVLESPFTSYAGLRYLLPFLHRLVFIPGNQNNSLNEPNTGEWAIEDIQDAIKCRKIRI